MVERRYDMKREKPCKRKKCPFSGGMKMRENPMHVCETMQKSRVDINIEKIGEDWFWVFYGKTKGEVHGIKYCPYCGMKLR